MGSEQTAHLDSAIKLLSTKTSLTREHAAKAMSEMIDTLAADSVVAQFLTLLKQKQETAEEIAGFVDSLRARQLSVQIDAPSLVDVCGTGGDNSGSFNVSTTMAFVLAAVGQKVVKHGNRSVSSKSGSFDVLEALKIPFCSETAKVSASLEQFNIAFLYAPAFHPALKQFGPVRRSLGTATVFNLLGPLLNPVVQLKRQLLGVYQASLVERIANVLLNLGTTHAMVVHGHGGVDEFSLQGPTQVAQLKNSKLSYYEVQPQDFSLATAPIAALKGGSAMDNADILLKIFSGEQGARRDVVLLNAAAALVVGGWAGDFKEGIEQAAAAIDSNKALKLVQEMGNSL